MDLGKDLWDLRDDPTIGNLVKKISDIIEVLNKRDRVLLFLRCRKCDYSCTETLPVDVSSMECLNCQTGNHLVIEYVMLGSY